LIVVLDSGPVGRVTNPRAEGENLRCTLWLQDLARAGVQFALPEIVDYEIRRELLRAGKRTGLEYLDGLVRTTQYLPITTRAMRMAAEFWATARSQGRKTADDRELDADVILAAQTMELARGEATDIVILATDNIKHLSQFVDARKRTEIFGPEAE